MNRPNPDFRGLAGSVAGGAVSPGDRVRVLPSGKETRVARIVTMEGDLDLAVAGQSVIKRGRLRAGGNFSNCIATGVCNFIIVARNSSVNHFKPYQLARGSFFFLLFQIF